jgi:hypothetical protein
MALIINSTSPSQLGTLSKFNEVDNNLVYLDDTSTDLSNTKANLSGSNTFTGDNTFVGSTNFIGNQDTSGSISADKVISPIYQGGAGEPYGKVSIPQGARVTVFEVPASLYASLILDAFVISKISASYYSVQNIYLTWEPNNLENINLSVIMPISSPSASGNPAITPAVPPTFGRDSLIYSTQISVNNIQLQVQNSTNDEVIYTSIVRAFTTTG